MKNILYTLHFRVDYDTDSTLYTVCYRKNLFSQWKDLYQYGIRDANGDECYEPVYYSRTDAETAITDFKNDLKHISL